MQSISVSVPLFYILPTFSPVRPGEPMFPGSPWEIKRGQYITLMRHRNAAKIII